MVSDQVSTKRVEQFLELLNANDRSTYAYILTQVPNFADADQLAQETRTRLWQQFDRYQEGTDFGAWSRSIAGYLVLAHYEKQSRERLRFGEAFISTLQEQVDSRIDGFSPRREALTECLKRMPQKHREMLLDYYADAHTRQGLADKLGKTYSSLRQAVCRARIALADCIDRRLNNASGTR
jgi:RNA polymerase sigma-70 factor (ECF subfamily)